MRIVVVQRSTHAGDVLHAADGAASLPWSSVVEVLDRHDIPDGLPFVVDDDALAIERAAQRRMTRCRGD